MKSIECRKKGDEMNKEMIESLTQMKRLVGDMEQIINRAPEPVKERWFFNTKSCTLISSWFQELKDHDKERGWIEITAEEKAYIETEPEPKAGFEWVLKVPEDGERWLCKKSRIESPKVGISSCPNERINGIRWTLVPVKVEPRFVEYDIIKDGLFYACSVGHLRDKDESVLFNLSDLPAIVGFAGYKFRLDDGTETDWLEDCPHIQRDGSPATPIKARFYVGGGK